MPIKFVFEDDCEMDPVMKEGKKEVKEGKKEVKSIEEIESLSLDDLSLCESWMRDGVAKGAPLKPTVTLFPHQIETVSWAQNLATAPREHGMKGGIISLQMGMGKTLSAYVMALALKLPRMKEKRPSLVICSKTLINTWRDDAAKFFDDSLNVLLFHKDFVSETVFNGLTAKRLLKYDVVVTTYDVCMQACKKGGFHEQTLEYGDEHTLQAGKVVRVNLVNEDKVEDLSRKGAALIMTTRWNHVFADESQRFCNPKTFTYKAMMAVPAAYRWCLTGTMVKNYQTDIWAQLRFVGYTGVREAPTWKRQCKAIFPAHRLERFIFEMGYEDAGIKMPEKKVNVVSVPLSKQEQELHDNILKVLKTLYKNALAGLVDYACVLEVFLRLRQCCVAPHLIVMGKKKEDYKLSDSHAEARQMFDDATEKYFDWILDGEGTAGVKSSKVAATVNLVEEIAERGEKVLVFSFFTSALTLVGRALEEKGIRYHQVDGSVTGKTRQELIERFKKRRRVKALLLSYKVGSEGLNLTVATNVILMEPWWNEAAHDQASHRAWRTGQTEEVIINQLKSANTIEDRVFELCASKKAMAEEYKQAGKKKLTGGVDRNVMGELLRM